MSANLHDDAYKGTLTEGLLLQYLTNSTQSFIDSIGDERKLTPLAAACLRGHLDVVRILLKNGADPNAVSMRERPPLFYVTSRTTKNRLDIVRALLEHHADVDKRFPMDDNATALMNAITETRDKEVIHELVDHGASLDAENSGGKSVRQLAKEVGMEQELLKKSERDAKRGTIIDLIVALVMFVITYVNSGIIKDVTVGTINKLYGISGAKEIDADVAGQVLGREAAKNLTKHLDGSPITPTTVDGKTVSGTRTRPAFGNTTNISQPVQPAQKDDKQQKQQNVNSQKLPVTVDDFKNSLDNYVKTTGLEKFFKRDDPFIQDLAEKAAALSKDKSTPLSKAENIKRLITLSLYHPVIYCDDSSSMRDYDRFAKQRHLVSRMARIATKIVPDGCGVDLRFINTRILEKNLSSDALDTYLAKAQPHGGTNIGTVLRRDILSPFVYKKIDAGAIFQRPLLVCAITDGAPKPEHPSTFKDVIVECRRKLVAAGYEPTSVMFCVSQIGNDDEAAAFLAGLRADEEIEDVLYCTAERLDNQFEELRENEGRLEEWLLKLLTKPIMERNAE